MMTVHYTNHFDTNKFRIYPSLSLNILGMGELLEGCKG